MEGNNGFLSALLCNWILIGQSNHSTTSGNGAFAHFEVGGKNAHIWPDKAVFTEMNFVQSGSEKKKKVASGGFPKRLWGKKERGASWNWSGLKTVAVYHMKGKRNDMLS